MVDSNNMKMSIQVVTYVDLKDNKSLQSALPTQTRTGSTEDPLIMLISDVDNNNDLPEGAVYKGNTGMGSMAGGYNPADIKSDKVQAIAKMNIKKLNSDHNKAKLAGLGLKQPVKLMKVKSAETQIVAGTNYKLDLLVKDKSGKKASLETVTLSDLKGVNHLESVAKHGAASTLGGTGAVGMGRSA